MTLRNARILSSCNDSSNKQEQKMHVNIRVEDKTQPQQPVYPQVNPVNFTTMEQPLPSWEGRVSQSEPTTDTSQFPSVAASQFVTRDIDSNRIFNAAGGIEQDLQKDMQIADLETKNKFLNLLLTVYQSNPIYINSYVVCDSQLLMSMIKLLTNCDKVDLVLNDDIACTNCCSNDKLIYVSKILITKGDKTEELKYSYNDVYSKFVAYGISLKIVC